MQLAQRIGDWRRFDRIRSKALAGAIESLILAGELLPGSRLPPERAFAKRLGVSRTLVVSAYALLRDAGWAESRQGSGTRVVRGVPGHVAATRRRTRSGNPMAGRVIDDKPVIDLSIAIAAPDPAWFNLSPGARTAMLQEYAYQPQGMATLREKIAARFCRQGIPTFPAQILVTTGAQQALSLLAQRYAAGQKALVEVPTYFGAIDCLRAAGATLLPVPVERRIGGPAEMARRVAAGDGDFVYVCPTVQNPTGITWSVSERRVFARAVAASGTLAVIDDSLSDLAFDGAPPTPALYASQAPIVTVGSLSKTLWGGLRIGWLRATDEIVAALASDRLVHDLGCSLVSSVIACDLLDRYDKLLHVRHLGLREQRDACAAALRRHLPQWRFEVPAGGLFLWVHLPRGDADAFAHLALEHGVRLTPGSGMYAGTAEPHRLRISYAATGDVWEEAAQRLAAAWHAFGE